MVALLLETSPASRKLVECQGLALQRRSTDGPDTVGGAARLVYADRSVPPELVDEVSARDV